MFSIGFFTSFSQEVVEEIVRVENDTIYSVLNIYTENKKLCEKRYYRKLQSQRGMNKEDFFMRGIRAYNSLDSVKRYIYNQNWELESEYMIQERDLIKEYKSFHYSSEEFEIQESFLIVEGKANQIKSLQLFINNLTPQNYYIKFVSLSKKLIFQDEGILHLNRLGKDYNFNVELKSGVNQIELVIENSNKKSKSLKIKTIGFDLSHSDFVDQSKLPQFEEIELNGGKEIFIEIKGNDKLLTIKNKDMEVKFPVSKVHNKLDKNFLQKGSYVLELLNLQSEEIKLCKVKVN
jgi:hypothetical protein